MLEVGEMKITPRCRLQETIGSRRMRRGSFLLVPRWGRGKASGLQRGETSGTRPSLFFSKKSIPADRSRIQSRTEFPREEKAARRCFFSHTHTVPAEGFFNFNFHLSEIRSSVTAPRRSFISCSSPCLKRTLSKNPSPSESTHS